MLSDAERDVLNCTLEKYRPGQSEPIFVGGNQLLKPALRLMSFYRLRIREIKDAKVCGEERQDARLEPRRLSLRPGLLVWTQSTLTLPQPRLRQASQAKLPYSRKLQATVYAR
jgi:hypothetical protein